MNLSYSHPIRPAYQTELFSDIDIIVKFIIYNVSISKISSRFEPLVQGHKTLMRSGGLGRPR